MHRLEYQARSQGGQNWSGAGAGYRAVCSCGKWTYDGIVRDPSNPGDCRDAVSAHMQHEMAQDD
jgi:hypothetical protein